MTEMEKICEELDISYKEFIESLVDLACNILDIQEQGIQKVLDRFLLSIQFVEEFKKRMNKLSIKKR